MAIVVKIGTSSLTNDLGRIDQSAIEKLCAEVAAVRRAGVDVVIVTSAAISAGLPALGFVDGTRPKDMVTLQAAAAVGQSRLLGLYDKALGRHDLVGGQILVSPHDFFERRQYLHVRDTLTRLLQLGVVPIVNENDAVTDDEIRFGDNDRIAALVAHAIKADQLILLTDTAGLFTSDPRTDPNASLVSEVSRIDKALLDSAGGPGSQRGSGGMASKLAAASMASWSGVEAVIAAAARPDVVTDAVQGVAVGTRFLSRPHKLSARKVWIAFAVAPSGVVTVDAGAAQALQNHGRSLLVPGIQAVEGSFEADAVVEIADSDGAVFARGVCRLAANDVKHAIAAAEHTSGLGPAVHRDDLVLL